MPLQPEEIDGALIIDKPAGPTSHDVVAAARRILRCKAGHAGTLDPAATGVLVLLLGQATRLSQFLLSSEKEYLAQVRFGVVTDTFDADGRVLSEQPVPAVSPEEAERALDHFRGQILQVPPMYSAVKVAGQPLYKAARRDEEVERPAREVSVHRLLLEEQGERLWRLRIVCSAGTYIRSIAHDLGQLIGCGARLESLRRVRSGRFGIDQSIPVEAIADRWKDGFTPVDRLLPELPEAALSEEDARRAVNGNPVARDALSNPGIAGSEYVRLTLQGRLLALASPGDNGLRPRIVLRSTV